ncbi:MAG: AraC family transcriptional regulator [Tannerellaceae bacterium]|nr:AraC family transcriptional regulator [Tannerellaceae bacterium]
MNTKSDIIIYNYLDTFFCCYVENEKLCEDMVSDHTLVYICSGEMILVTKEKRITLKKGDSFFLKRNHLIKKIKQPSKNGESFKGLFLQLKTPFLKKIYAGQGINLPANSDKSIANAHHVMLEKHPFFDGLFISLEQYFNTKQYPSKELMDAKLKEAIFALLQLKPELSPVLFDFAGPWKPDLADFMINNYKCDLSVEEFAHYTGRSLSTFKKDFARIFHETPSRWLVKKRLEEAMDLINKGQKPSEVYLNVGFKNLSHFSTAFKKQYGYAPSLITRKRNIAG